MSDIRRIMRVFILIIFLHPAFSLATYPVVRQSADTLELSVNFPEPTLSLQTNLAYDVYACERGEVMVWTNGPAPRVETVFMESKTLQLNRPARYTEDIPVGLSDSGIEAGTPDLNSLKIRSILQETERTLWQIVLNPVESLAFERNLIWTSQWRIRLTGAGLDLQTGALSRLTEASLSGQGLSKSVSTETLDSGIKSGISRKKRLKMWIREEGLYILLRDVIVRSGFDIRSVDPRYLRVTGRRGEVPIRVVGEQDGRFDAGDAIEFWGEPLWEYQPNGEKRLDPFATDNIYWLEIGDSPGLRMGQETGIPSSDSGIRSAGRSFLYTEHKEHDNFFTRLPWHLDTDEGDHWFYSSGIGGAKSEIIFETKNLDSYSIQLARLTIHLRGNSSNSLPQPIEVYINERLVIPEQSLLNEKKTFESEGFSPMFLREGKNILTLVNRSTEKELSQVYLDWFEISYPRLYKTDDNLLKFKGPPYSEGRSVQFIIEYFTEDRIDVYKLGTSHIYQPEIEAYKDSLGDTKYRIIFQDQIQNTDEDYLAIGHSQKRLPDSLQTVITPDLKNTPLNADYVIITPRDSLSGTLLSPLLSQRKKQGLRCAVVSLDTLYDNFSGGIPNPEAIHLFLKHAYQTWQRKPRFCVLIGDGFYHMRRTDEKGNLMPFFHYQTYKYGAAASDHFYTLLDGDDDLPDIAIGRLPVQSRAELQSNIEKIVAYEESPPDPWKNHYLMIASDRQTGTFGEQTETLIHEVLPKSLDPGRLFLQGSLSSPYVGGTEDLLRQLEEGIALVNFRGHGGGAIWADAGLLDLDDIELIENRGRLPVMTSMTCFTADFASSRRSLGEELICHEETGAIAFFGASGVGWVYNDYYLLGEIYALIETNPELTVGELFQFGKRNFLLKNPGEIAISSVYQYSLLGDPAIRLTFPTEKLSIQPENASVAANDPIRVQTVENLQTGEIQLSEVASDGSVIVSSDYTVDTLPFQTDLPASPGYPIAGIRAYAWNSETGYQAHGYIPIQIGKAFFDSVFTLPSTPTYRDTLYFAASIQNHSEITRAWCLIFSVNQDSVIDSLVMSTPDGSSGYKTLRGLSGLSPGSVLRYAIFTLDQTQTFSSSDTVLVRIPTLPDLSISNIALDGLENTRLKITIQNFGGEPVNGARVHVTSEALGFESDAEGDVPGYGQSDVQIPFHPVPGIYRFDGTVQAGPEIMESNLSNNSIAQTLEMDQFDVTPQEGTGGWIGYPDVFDCSVPPGAVSEASVLKIERIDFSESGIEEFSSQATEPMYQLWFLASVETPTSSPFQIRFFRSTNDSLKAEKPYRRDSSLQQWVYQPFVDQDSLVLFESRFTGLFRLMYTEDETPPQVELQVENQPFTAMSYVPKHARFSVLIQDDSGVDPRPEAAQVYIDDRVVTSERLIAADSVSQIRSRLVMFDAEFDAGNHQIQVEASDIHGNHATTGPLSFRVSEAFSLQYLGNHPNPFRRETVFVYVLTDAAHQISLKIYTVSGRLIREYHDAGMSAPDYHEIIWDGADTWGDEVANGVYFFRLKAKQDDRLEEITGKIAKIR